MTEKVVLYGAGRYGAFAALVLQNRDAAPCCFCDKNISDGIEPITGLPIISPQALKNDYCDSEIIITSARQTTIDKIYADLEALGIDESRISLFYSLHDAIMQNSEFINCIARYGTRVYILLLHSVLKNNMEINKDVLRLKDLYLPYDINEPHLMACYSMIFLNYLADLPYTRKNVDVTEMIQHKLCHPYILCDEDVPMIINKGDVVLDVGAWYGDFSLLAAKVFNAEVYAFEPSDRNFEMLLKTIALNNLGDKIHTVKAGLGNCAAQLRFENNLANSDGSKISNQGDELITVTTIDDFVTENELSRVDFIKADVEGYEREMLKGGVKTMQRFAPKLSICTYHLPDDPLILRDIISKANPAYKFEQRRNILFAWVD